MTLSPSRVGISSIAGAALLSLALVGSTAAQVATLSEPDTDAEQTAAPLAGELDGAIEAARSSSDQTPWLYEALQLEGDILVARAGQHRGRGDLERAREDLLSAGRAYARGLEVARSDAWLYAAEARRLIGETLTALAG